MSMERITQQVARSWRRLHFSTWLLLTLLLSALVLANLRGEKSPRDFAEAIDEGEDVCWHGWPVAFLRRQLHTLEGIADIDAWAITEHVMEISSLTLLADIIAGALVLALAALVLEWRRRRRGRFWQFTLAEWLTAISILAVALACWKHRKLADGRIEANARAWLAREERLGTNRHLELHWEPNLPAWIRKAAGDEAINWLGCRELTLRTHGWVPAKGDELGVTLLQGILERNPSVRLQLNYGESPDSLRRFPILKRLALPQDVELDCVPFDNLTNLRGLRLHYHWLPRDDRGRTEPSGGALLAQLSKLEYFRGDRDQIGDEGIEALASLGQLTMLHLAGVTDEDMFRLSALKKLRVLVLPASQLTDNGWSAIAKLTRLEQLIVRGDFGDAALMHLKGVSRLRVLDLHNSDVSDAGLSAIGQCTTLEELDLGGCAITGRGLAELAPLRSLTSLDLGDCPLRDSEFLNLPNLPRLEYLCLSRTGLMGAGLAVVNGRERLRRLEINYSRVRSLRELDLTGLPALETIWAGRTGVSDEEAAQLETLRPELLISVNHFRQTAAGFRSRLAAIREGRGSGMSLLCESSIDARLAELRDLPALEELDIHGGPLDDRHLEAVAQISGLKVLRLYATSVTLQGLRHLEKLSNLRGLALGQTDLAECGLRPFPCLNALEALALDESQLNKQVVDRLKQLPSFRKLLVGQWRHHCIRRKDSLVWLDELRRQLPKVEVIGLPLDLEETQLLR